MDNLIRKITSILKLFLYKFLRKEKLCLLSKRNYLGKNVTMRWDDSACKISLNGVRLNNNVLLSVSEGGTISLGKHVGINVNTVIVAHEEITVGNNVSIGPNVCIYDHDYYFDSKGFRKNEFKTTPVHIGDNTWIGAGCIILRGSNIGSNCVIGAGVVVKGNIPDNTIVKANRNVTIEKLH